MDARTVTWVRIPRAAKVLGVSEDTVRRMIADGRLDITVDPAALQAAAANGRGRPPTVLVSLESVLAARARQAAADTWDAAPPSALVERLQELEEEVARTRAELAQLRASAGLSSDLDEPPSRLEADLSNIRHVALQSLARDEALERAERARLESERSRIDAEEARLDAGSALREQLRVFLVPDHAPKE